jgi:hypothetical protein
MTTALMLGLMVGVQEALGMLTLRSLIIEISVVASSIPVYLFFYRRFAGS